MSSKVKNDDASAPHFRLSVEYFFTAVAAWLVPGCGHWLLGYRVRGALLGASILVLFWAGQRLAVPPEGSAYPRTPMAVSFETSPYLFYCQIGNGFSAILSDALWGEPRYTEMTRDQIDRELPRHWNLGILFTSVSGLLNFLLVLHALDPRSWEEAARHSSRGILEEVIQP